MLRVPSTLKVGPYRLMVRIDEQPDENRPDALGFIDATNQLIWLQAKQGTDSLAVTLLHECLHLLWDLSGADFSRGEAVARRLDAGLLSLLRDNPALVAFLMGTE